MALHSTARNRIACIPPVRTLRHMLTLTVTVALLSLTQASPSAEPELELEVETSEFVYRSPEILTSPLAVVHKPTLASSNFCK